MSLRTVEVHCSESKVENLLKNIVTYLKKNGYSVQVIESENREKPKIFVKKRFYSWEMIIELKKDRTGNKCMVKIFNVERFSIDELIEKGRRKIESQQRDGGGSIWSMFWRMRWIALIFGSITFVILGLLYLIFRSYEAIALGFAGLIMIFLIYYFGSNLFSDYIRKNQDEKGKELISIIHKMVQDESEKIEKQNEEIVCWNCYKEVVPRKRKCPNCGVKLIPVEK